ncbi:MAG TPA: bacteriohopanetetrol glucosamine biosynthesis glycosyltransferase HpnI [Stellaceae bacterium]|nr:bacteriohopanetetrol glucosamine biosynthesis glycosyltransferase HpnI [Stellaceae bacterium]
MSGFGLPLILLLTWGYLVLSTFAALHFARRRRAARFVRDSAGEPVTVLKPLHGAEPGLVENLRSFAAQDYGEFQLVFGVRERRDGALPVACALAAGLPGRDIEVIVDPHVSGSNLKVANLENMMPAARHDLIVVADSDMRVAPDYLRIVTAPLADSQTGIVTCLYKGVSNGGLWSLLAAMHINYSFMPGAIVGESLDIGGGCFGATIALRREVLDAIGGFARLRNELADDHRMGSAVRALGLKAVLSTCIVENRVSEPSFLSLWQHELRWARTSRAMAPLGFAGSAIGHTTMMTALAVAFCASGGAAWGFVLISIVLRWISAGLIARALNLPRRGLWLLPLRDALSFAVFLSSFCGRSVAWRDQIFRVEPSGRIRVEGDKPV